MRFHEIASLSVLKNAECRANWIRLYYAGTVCTDYLLPDERRQTDAVLAAKLAAARDFLLRGKGETRATGRVVSLAEATQRSRVANRTGNGT
jgi:hypothetical protein